MKQFHPYTSFLPISPSLNHQRNISTLSENPTQRIHFLLPFSIHPAQYSTTFQSLSIPLSPFKPINSRFCGGSRRTTILRVPRTSLSVPRFLIAFLQSPSMDGHVPRRSLSLSPPPVEGQTAYRSYRWNEPRLRGGLETIEQCHGTRDMFPRGKNGTNRTDVYYIYFTSEMGNPPLPPPLVFFAHDERNFLIRDGM